MRRFLACLFTLSLCVLPAQGVEPVTRGQFVLLLWQANGGVPFEKTAHPFTDISDDGVSQAAAWAYEAGLVLGVGGGRFAPDRPLTRQEQALLLRRNDARLGLEEWGGDGAAACNDWAEVSPWMDDSLYRACVTGRLPWREGRLAPQAPVTTAEARASLSAWLPAEDG